jgi:hypothetical protein
MFHDMQFEIQHQGFMYDPNAEDVFRLKPKLAEVTMNHLLSKNTSYVLFWHRLDLATAFSVTWCCNHFRNRSYPSSDYLCSYILTYTVRHGACRFQS